MGVLKNKTTGNYYIRVKHHGREHEKVIGTDKRAAEIALKEIKNEIQMAKLAGQGWEGFQKMQKEQRPRTFKEAAEDYLEERTHFKSSSVSAFKSIATGHLIPEFGNYSLKSITDSHLRKYQGRLAAKVSASRVNTIMQLLRSILSQEYKAGRLDRDPSLAVRRMQEPKTKIDPLSEEELEQVFANIEEHYRPLFITLAFTGARPNELLALRWNDIDWKSKGISITKGRVRGAEGLPKTKSGERVVPMAPRVEQALNTLKQLPNKVVSANGYIFTTPAGQPMNKHLDRIWARALKKAKLHHRPSYQLRHTFVTQCIIKGLPLPYIAKVIGHSTIDTLIRHYAGWIESATKTNDDKLKAMFVEAIQPKPKQTKKVGVKGGV